MKKIILFIIFISVFLGHQVFAESISGYEVEMHLNNDASVLVTEKITYSFDQEKHGIFRFIPVFFDMEQQSSRRYIDINVLSVERNGTPEVFTDDLGIDEYSIKIGDPNNKITGVQNYKITYLVEGSLRYFDTYDEVYWNVTGDKWPVSIADVKIFLSSDDILFTQSSCYMGMYGDSRMCDHVSNQNEIIFSASDIQIGEGVTIAARFGKNQVPVIEKNIIDYLERRFLFLALVIGVCGFGIFFVRRKLITYTEKYKQYDPIHPRYEPPVEISAVFAGYLLDKSFGIKEITGGIIQLAYSGYVHIEKIKEDYIITRKKSIEETLETKNNTWILIMELLFNSSDDNAPSIYKKINELVPRSSNEFISNSPQHKDVKWLESIRISDISEVRAGEIIVYLREVIIDKAVRSEYIEAGYNYKKSTNWILGVPIFIMFVMGFFWLFAVSIVGTLLLSFIKKKYFTRYTKKGWLVKNHIAGFKLFLEMTERDRYEFHNPPEKNPQEFMKYLSYAIAMGIEEKWAEQFKDVLIPKQEWLSGVGTLSSVDMVHDISSFTRAIQSSTSPSRSSSSGSGGGGFSGGGSGGGGGGGW